MGKLSVTAFLESRYPGENGAYDDIVDCREPRRDWRAMNLRVLGN
jgi:hypothetical protein